ncbi:MAG: flagellar hook-basal body complex protein FliE [Phycisphaeraceae bacterium]|nr:flagellar hook-basal body complex protein FliE [Phycisphaeraceae bacterium]
MTDPLGLIGSVQRPAVTRPPVGPGQETGPSFKDVLKANIDQVNRLQQDAEMAIEDLVSGRRDDVGKVLVAKEKADMAFQMLLQVRNKLADAYEEIKQVRV